MFTKFAKLDVLEVKSSPERARTASLSKFADFSDYRTEDGFVYVRVRAISSRVNKNHDGWPSSELEKSYRTFIGKPIFVDHHNHDPKRARGVIVDAALHREDAQKVAALDPYYANAPQEHMPPTWIELLLEVDAKRFPRLAKAVVSGDIDGVSMGANVEVSKCSHCANTARSPEEYCKHVRSKGAYFDYHDPRTGEKTSKRSYEDCYGIGFFEISFVFDPADETALVSDVKRSSRIASIQNEGVEKTALQEADPGRHAPPQADMTVAPEKVDTLRQEQLCPICGSDMEDGVCEVCNYEEPPEGFDNPDLDKAKEVDEQMRDQDAEQAAAGQGQQAPTDVQVQGQPGSTPTPGMATNPPVTGASINDKTSGANGGRINTQERPILPATRQLTDKPKNQKTISDSTKPVASNTRKENMSTKKIADGATADGGADVQPEKRVDVEGVGGFTGDPLSGIQHENVEKAMEQKAGPSTDTWSNGEGDSLGQQDAVTSETGDFFTVSNEHTADASNDVGGPIGEAVGDGGSAKGGIKTWDTSDGGFPDHDPSRVDLNAPLKEEVGEGTATDSGEQYRSLKHTDPVTQGENANSLGGPIGQPVSSFGRAVQAMKLAEAEEAMGLTANKWDRLAELESKSDDYIAAALETVSKVKSAKTASITKKTAGVAALPSLQNKQVVAGVDPAVVGLDDVNVEDSIW